METTTTRKWSEGEVLALLIGSEKAVCRAIVALDNRQTSTERACYSTRETNGRGWSQFDARLGGWLADQIRKGVPPYAPAMKTKARSLAKKYRRQLVEIANENEANGRNEAARTVATARLAGAMLTDAEVQELGRAVRADIMARAARRLDAPSPDDAEWIDG